MTRLILLSTAIVTGLMVTGSALAFGGPQDPADRPSFSQLDTDGDGKLTAAEMQAFPAARAAARFEAADTDGDGKITKAELAASIEQMRAGRNAARADNMISRFDTDGDGAVSEAEMTAAMDRNRGRTAAPGDRFFGWADTDGDGAISEAEYDAAATAMQQRAGRFSERGPRRGGKQAPFWRN